MKEIPISWLAFLLPLAAQAASGFDPGCELPFTKIAKHHRIDDQCSIEGEGGRESITLQNRQKNNFRANNAPIQLEFTDFAKLQDKADSEHIAHGRDHLPQSRDALKDIMQIGGQRVGEGKVVRLSGYLVDPHYSDTDHGESVNCKIPGKASNDIHMNVSAELLTLPKKGSKIAGKTKGELLCSTIVAEVAPHFRPEAWEVSSLKRAEKNGLPVRLTGQLFFDASHNTCRDGHPGRGDPARYSLWEIHPVYRIELCSKAKLESCLESDWKELD